MTKKALFLAGGWEGHEPQETSRFISNVIERYDIESDIINDLDILGEKNKLEKGIISEGKKPEEVYSGEIDKEPIDELSFGAALEKLLKTNEKLKDATKKLEEGFEKDVNYALEVENKLRLKKIIILIL